MQRLIVGVVFQFASARQKRIMFKPTKYAFHALDQLLLIEKVD
jgi:hypothetical protein